MRGKSSKCNMQLTQQSKFSDTKMLCRFTPFSGSAIISSILQIYKYVFCMTLYLSMNYDLFHTRQGADNITKDITIVLSIKMSLFGPILQW